MPPIALFHSIVLNAFFYFWKESFLCSIKALHRGKYSLKSLVGIWFFLASAVLGLVKYSLTSFTIFLSFLVIPCLVLIAFGRVRFLFLFPCYFFHYLPCLLSIVFVFIKQRSIVIFLWSYFKLFKKIFAFY